MILRGEIVPRPDAAPDQCRELGAALRMWFDKMVAEVTAADPDAEAWIDGAALDDLAAGELPSPALLRLVGGESGLSLRHARDAVDEARSVSPLARMTLPTPTARSVPFGMSSSVDVHVRIITALFGSIPLGIVAEISIDGEAGG